MVRILCVAVALGLFASAGVAEEEKDKKVKPVEKLEKKDNPLDKDFLIAAAQCGNNCANVLSIVEKHASSDKVKEFAAHVKKDHDELTKEHAEVTKAKKVVIIPSLDKEASAKISELKKKDKADFDKAFLADFVEGHEKSIKAAEYQKANGKDEDVSKLAEKMIPVLKKHLEDAKKLQKDIG